jgi:hypothetical protein
MKSFLEILSLFNIHTSHIQYLESRQNAFRLKDNTMGSYGQNHSVFNV